MKAYFLKDFKLFLKSFSSESIVVISYYIMGDSMNKVIDICLVFWNFIMSSFSYVMGGIDNLLIMFLVVMIIDYLTGICKAIINKKLNSIVGLKGIIKKFGYLLIIALSVLIDKILGDSSAISALVIYFFIANEGISILENWGQMGLPLPSKLKEIFEQLKKDNDI